MIISDNVKLLNSPHPCRTLPITFWSLLGRQDSWPKLCGEEADPPLPTLLSNIAVYKVIHDNLLQVPHSNPSPQDHSHLLSTMISICPVTSQACLGSKFTIIYFILLVITRGQLDDKKNRFVIIVVLRHGDFKSLSEGLLSCCLHIKCSLLSDFSVEIGWLLGYIPSNLGRQCCGIWTYGSRK